MMRGAMARIAAWLRTLPPIAILAIGWFVFFMLAYPGHMTKDSWDQLAQARSGVFMDDHPPLMQAIAWVTDRLVAGPIGMVMLQSLLFLAGTYLLLRRAMSARVAAIAACLVLLFPPVIAVLVVMWKDSLMAGALMLAAALIISPNRSTRLCALALALVGGGVRFNGLAATFGIVVLLFEWLPDQRRVRRYALAFGVWAAITAASFVVNAMLTDREMHYTHTMLVDDIVGTLAFESVDRSDEELRGLLAGTKLRIDRDIHRQLRRAHRSDTMLWLHVGEARMFDVSLTESPPAPLRKELMRAWKATVLGSPGAFLQYRADRFRVVIGLQAEDEKVWDDPIIITHTYQDRAMTWQYGVSSTTSSLQRCYDDVLTWLSHTWLFRPWIYLLLTLVFIVLARRNQVVLALLLSGLGIELSLFFLAHSADYRYSHWMICTTIVAAIMLFAERLRGNSGRA